MSAPTARDVILGRITNALADVPGTEGPDAVTVARDYRISDTSSREDVIERFLDLVADYKATVHRVREPELRAAIAAACESRAVKSLAVPEDVPQDWIPAGVTAHREPGLSVDDLDRCDGVLTGCSVGIAQTGTVVLDSGPLQGRRVLTLVPDYHLCVVRADQVVGLVPEAIARIMASPGGTRRPITFISGPSATSDIELNRVEGVHGPRTLEVILVEPAH